MATSCETIPKENWQSQYFREEEMSNAAIEVESSPPAKKSHHYLPILPPCKICGTRATGYHFGVITCEACKIFFRRSLGRQKPYHCKGSGNCSIIPDRRQSCSFCRLQKCNRLGMSREGIQRGRYTVKKKSRCILEVKHLESQNPETTQSNGMDSGSSYDGRSSEETMQPKSVGEKSSLPAGSNGMSLQELEETTKVITAADQKTLMIEDAHIMEKLKAMRDSVEFDQPEDTHEVGQRYRANFDKKKHKFAKCIVGLVEDIEKFVKFAKLLPGFLELCMEDQILLLREGMLHWFMISVSDSVDSKTNVAICPTCHTVFRPEDFMDIGDPGFYRQNMLAAKALHRLKLYPEEVAVFKALALYSPDGSEGNLKDPQKVEDLQATMVDVLCYLIQKNRNIKESSDGAIMLGRSILTLTETTAASIKCKQTFDQCFIQLFPDIAYPELLLEILGEDRVSMLQTLRATNNSLETEVTGLEEHVSPAPGPVPCDCDAINKSDFGEHSDSLARQQQMAHHEENVPLNMTSKIAADRIATNLLSRNVGLLNISSIHTDSVERPPKKVSMLQTVLSNDATIWEKLRSQTEIDIAGLRRDKDGSNLALSECADTCSSYHAGKKSLCIPPDVLKYLFSRAMFPQDDDDPILERQTDSITGGGEKVKIKKKHHEASSLLPPCKVCNGKASGFHFGEITCDACQIFFRRSLERHKPYICEGNGDCNVIRNQGGTCSYCRLQKCHQLGMSRDAIQRGRYTVKLKKKIASNAPPAKVQKETNEGHPQESPKDKTSLNGPNIFEKDASGVMEASDNSEAMDSPPYPRNQELHSDGASLERSSPVSLSGVEANEIAGIPINAFDQSGQDRMINDANNNIPYDPVSSKGIGGLSEEQLSSSMDAISSAFCVMNDTESNEYVYPQAYLQSHTNGGTFDDQSRGEFMDNCNQSPNDYYYVDQPNPVGPDVLSNRTDEISCSSLNEFSETSTTSYSSAVTASPSSFSSSFHQLMPPMDLDVSSDNGQAMDCTLFSTRSSAHVFS